MKHIFLGLIALLTFMSCSKDEQDEPNLSDMEMRLVGDWYPTTDYEDIWYSYYPDGTSKYYNLYFTADGVWEIVDGNVLIEFYPDSDESYENWQENPTLKSYIEFTDDYTLQTVDFYDSSSTSTKYKECDPCPPRAQEYTINFSGFGSPDEQYPLEITYYFDDENGDLVSATVNSNTNTDIVESNTLITYDKIGFKYQTSSESQAEINMVEVRDKNDEVIFSSSDLSVDIGQTFMFDISDDSYSIN
ncbi:hypothetical protein [Flagellimonas marinaquae]|uniref:hypothetical protein n=1 Tax=Flagellimonas marinaquae TaxID=254955 RepID=UPI000F8EEB96|nr:hypothetical protein [Allomuricauda aquimarina]